ncbi:MAG: endopeptidase La [Bacilli bacterium]|nr:endopeptidase La [Bacilli bacterium]
MVETNLPILFLRDVVLLPYNELRIEFSKDYEKKILEISERRHDNHILFVNLVDSLEERPSIRKLPKIAILGKVKTKIELPNGVVRIVVVGIDRVEVLNYIENEDNNYEAFVIPTKDYDYNELESNALKRILLKDLNNYIEISSYISNNVLGRISGVNSIARLTDIIVDEMPFDYLEKIKYVEMPNPMNRIKFIIEDLNKEMETVKLENELEDSLKEKLDLEQKNYILREKIRLIKEELNEEDIKDSEVAKLKKKVSELSLPKRVSDRLNEEINRYEFTASTSPEVAIIRNYIDWLISLPWGKSTKDNNDIEDIRKKLNDTHCGLDDVKERIVEYIAINKRNKSERAPILCLIGPPGTGKTSMAKSIAKAIKRKFVKVSVGGVHDEGEIVGHRRTYMGASPGKIIQGIKKVGVNNPVFLIDEIDKLTNDYKGDPGSALLDILDKEQNNIFQDNYIEEEFDLSNVLFILTGNDEKSIPGALKDRLEIIHLSGYTVNEKEDMVNNYIIPRFKEQYNFSDIEFTKNSIKDTIMYYTMETGVRELERCIDSVFRKVIIDSEITGNKKYVIDDISEYLGNYKYKYMYNDKGSEVGVVNTLGYTPYGGCLLKTTSAMYSGNGNITLTGSLGEVIRESVYVAMGYIKTNSVILDIDNKVFKENDFHIHFESGSVFKEGPSGGVALITSIISLIKNKPIDSNISMTGEITLRGKILPVGGIKEKILVAINNNIKTIYVPIDNKADVKEISKDIIKGIKIKYINNYLELYNDLF